MDGFRFPHSTLHDTAQQGNNEALENFMNARWKPLPLKAPYEFYGGEAGVFSKPEYCKLSGMVYVRGIIKRAAKWVPSDTLSVEGLPKGYRPKFRESFCCFGEDSAAGSQVFRVDVAANGTIVLETRVPPNANAPQALTYMFLNFSFVAER